MVFFQKIKKSFIVFEKKLKTDAEVVFPETYCIPFSEMHLFRSWSCLAAVSLVSANLNKWQKIIHAKDESSYQLFANFVHV